MSDGAAGPAPSTKPLTVAVVLAVTMFAFDALAVPTIMPEVVGDLGGVALYGAVFSAFMLGSIVSMVVGGHVADSRGPSTSLGAGVVLFVVGIVAGALAPSMTVFVVARAVQGLGAGTVGSTVYAAVGRGYPPEARSRMFAITSAAWILPGLVGPALAASVAEAVGWRWVLWGLLPLPLVVGALAVPALRRLVPEAPEPMPAGVAAAAVRLAVGAGLVLVLTSGDLAVPLAAQVPVAAGGVWLAAGALGRLFPPGVVRAAPGVPAAIASRALLTGCFFAVEGFLPLAITGIHGRSTLFAGLILTAASMTWALGAFLQSRRVEAWGLGPTARAGTAIMVAGVVLSTTVLVDDIPAAGAIGAWLVAGLGMGLAFNSITVHAMDHTPPGREGRAGAHLQVGDALAIAVTTGVGGALVSAGETNDWSLAPTLAVVWALLVAVGLAATLTSRQLLQKPLQKGVVDGFSTPRG